MNLEAILKAQGLTEEQITAIMGAMKENKIYTTNEENIDVRYSKLKVEKDDLKGKLDAADKTIEDLKAANKDNETLQATIKTHEETISTLKTDYETKIKDMNISTAIKKELACFKYPELIEAKIDKSKLTVADDGKVFGIAEEIAVIKETYKDLVIPVVTGRDPNNTGGTPPGGKNPWGKEHFNLTEQGKILRENPELAASLKAAAGK